MSDYYHAIQNGTTQEDSDAILAVLNKIKEGVLENDMRLLNYYHEIPVSYGASVDFVEGDMVDLGIHQHQAVVMRLERTTVIKSRHFLHAVIAKVFRADVTRCLATLTNFSYGLVRADRRRFVRVAVSDDVDVVFMTETATVTGRMTDVSVGGVSMWCGQEDGTIDIGTRGFVRLSIMDTPLEMPARLLKCFSDASRFRYIFEVDASRHEEAVISRFIFLRQVEIIRELKDQII